MIKEILPTKNAHLIALISISTISAFWLIFDSILPLMPYKLEANLLLTKISLSLILVCISLLLILISVVKSHNQLSIELKEAQFNNFVTNPITFKL